MHSSKTVSGELLLLTYLSSKHFVMHITLFLYQQGMTHPESSNTFDSPTLKLLPEPP